MTEKQINHMKRDTQIKDFVNRTDNRSKEFIEGVLLGVELIDKNFDVSPEGGKLSQVIEYLKGKING